MTTPNFLGYLTWWTVPDCAAPYAKLNQLATQVGFPLIASRLRPPLAMPGRKPPTSVGRAA